MMPLDAAGCGLPEHAVLLRLKPYVCVWWCGGALHGRILPNLPPRSQIAYSDQPFRVLALDFNISAPSLQAIALEQIALRPGEDFLDIGTDGLPP
jgi:fructose 1,6-bisphosphatase